MIKRVMLFIVVIWSIFSSIAYAGVLINDAVLTKRHVDWELVNWYVYHYPLLWVPIILVVGLILRKI